MKKSMDGNTAAAHIAYAFSETCALYPITPSSTMGELIDAWASEGRKNLFGQSVKVVEMQSEAGAAGAVHGMLSAGSFSSTFTASQGLLLMIPNMYKIAGELMPAVIHVSARAIAGQALSIFGDHQDVMATRATGFCLLASSSVQECMDLSLVAHLSTLQASLPFLHFFDGFRTSHEIQKIEVIDYEDIKPLIDEETIKRHRLRALNPDHPIIKGSAQNPDIYFQVTEAANKYYLDVPRIVEEAMDDVYKLTKRRYNLFDYVGDSNATRIIVMMGSGAEAAEETIDYLCKRGEKVGLIKVRLYRPFSKEHFLKTLPKTVERIAVLDRTKEGGGVGEPLYLDVCSVLEESSIIKQVVGGRYGLGSKDLTPSMIKAVLDNLKNENSKKHFTVGIEDDVTHTSLPVLEKIDSENSSTVRCKFWGIGGDGTIGANKDAIKIIGDNTDKYVQGYFAYDSKKSGGVTVSHLRFGDFPIKATYLIQVADYIACHAPSYVKNFDLLEGLKKKGIFVLNTSEKPEELSPRMKKYIAENEIQFYMINALEIAKKLGLGGRINTIMQTIFFKLSEILPIDQALSLLKGAIAKTYAKRGEKIVKMNQDAVDLALQFLEKVDYPLSWKSIEILKKEENLNRPEFVRNVVDVINAQKGDSLPVSAFIPGGVFPIGTAAFEKRGIAVNLPLWIPENCIQCNLCSFVCPHAAIRPFLATEGEAKKAPDSYAGLKPIGKDMENLKYSIVISPLDCTGCEKCHVACPAPKGKALVMKPFKELEAKEEKLWNYFTSLPEKKSGMSKFSIKGSQFQKPLFEFSGACSGCGETPYLKLLTQLFGDRMIIANATGCSSIFGGSAPSFPWTINDKGEGPAWANSLFEDNGEFGYGIALAVAHRRELLKEKVVALKESQPAELKALFEEWLQNYNDGEKTRELSEKIGPLLKEGTDIHLMKDLFVKPSIWIIGGDGWAYDIGFGGLDHVIAQDVDVNILVLDTEVYSNTGGQASKSTPVGAVAKFAASGKKTNKKDLGLMAMTYETVYVASTALDYDKNHVIKVMKEAESYPGPSLIIAYAACINHCDLAKGYEEEKKAVEAGYWFTYRYDPRLETPFQLDSKEPSQNLNDFLKEQIRFNLLAKTNPEEAKKLQEQLRVHLEKKYQMYKKMSAEKKE